MNRLRRCLAGLFSCCSNQKQDNDPDSYFLPTPSCFEGDTCYTQNELSEAFKEDTYLERKECLKQNKEDLNEYTYLEAYNENEKTHEEEIYKEAKGYIFENNNSHKEDICLKSEESKIINKSDFALRNLVTSSISYTKYPQGVLGISYLEYKVFDMKNTYKYYTLLKAETFIIQNTKAHKEKAYVGHWPIDACVVDTIGGHEDINNDLEAKGCISKRIRTHIEDTSPVDEAGTMQKSIDTKEDISVEAKGCFFENKKSLEEDICLEAEELKIKNKRALNNASECALDNLVTPSVSYTKYPLGDRVAYLENKLCEIKTPFQYYTYLKAETYMTENIKARKEIAYVGHWPITACVAETIEGHENSNPPEVESSIKANREDTFLEAEVCSIKNTPLEEKRTTRRQKTRYRKKVRDEIYRANNN